MKTMNHIPKYPIESTSRLFEVTMIHERHWMRYVGSLISKAHQPEDDWTGVTDPVERRKRQNRLSQRAWRRRKAVKTHVFPHQDEGRWNGFGILQPLSLKPSSNDAECCVLDENHDRIPHGRAMPETKPATKFIPPLIPYLEKGATLKARHIVVFPLSLDHRLITLIQYNVLRATMTNLSILALTHTVPVECGVAISIFDNLPTPATIPPSLEPTSLQRSTPHEPWIDCFPAPRMRDNLIRWTGCFDPDDLCCDLSGGLYEGFDDVEKRGMIIWGEPWQEDGWEITEGFAEKWGFLLEGCHEMIDYTNQWRAQRGEDPLVVEV